MAPHRRRLPHIYPEGTPLLLTWHLHGSMPASLLPPPGPLSSGQAFVWLDRQLDNLRTGPMYLRQSDIAQIVACSIYKGVDLRHYELCAYVVMAKSCASVDSAEDRARSLNEITQGCNCPRGQPPARTNGRALLAERVLRSLGAEPTRVREDSSVHRKQSGEGRPGARA